jgi:signal transduction histidine kinase
MRSPNMLLRRDAFRRTLGFATVLAAAMLLLTGFIYWRTVGYLGRQVDRNLLADARTLAAGPANDVPGRLQTALAADPRGTRVAGLFDANGRFVAGNLKVLPQPLPPEDQVVASPEAGTLVPHGDGSVRIAVKTLPDGQHLVFGRRVDELDEITEIVGRALALAALPIAGLALFGGAILSRATQLRVAGVERACRRIMAGHLDERLPVGRGGDAFDALSATVNRMLEEVERLMQEVKGAGDAVAHDLRTPLTRLRARLERLRGNAADPGDREAALDRTVADVDQLLAMTRAILRIGEIENGRRRAGFGSVALDDIVREVADFYAVVAEEKGIAFTVSAGLVPPIQGDGELLFEAIGNLVDNAIKFTSAGGRVDLSVEASQDGPVVQVSDTGPGIPAEEREAVLRRFYRTDPSRRVPGTGLGLALVAAIVRLHGFTLDLRARVAGSGCTVTLTAGH